MLRGRRGRRAGDLGSASSTSAASDAATGPGQLDYLRRLAGTIAALRQASRASGDRRDQQRRLRQAARPAGAAQRVAERDYFTFDMDARFLEQRNLKTTRQLIVGRALVSHCGPSCRATIPPFATRTEHHVLRDHAGKFTGSSIPRAPTPISREGAVRQGKDTKSPSAPQCRTETDQGKAVTAPRLFDPAQPQQAGLQWTAHPRIFEIAARGNST